MEKPGKKLKKFFIITGITGMVYAGLKYLLPLVVPLLLGYTLALLLRPSARFLQHRITVRIFGKKWKPSLGLIGSVQLLILAVLGSFLLTLGIRRLWEETSTLMNQLPVWLDGLYFWIEEKCSGLEKRFGLDPGWGIHVAGSMIEAGTKYVKEKSVPSLMVGSYYTAGVIGRIGFISLFYVMLIGGVVNGPVLAGIYKPVFFLQRHFKLTGNGRVKRTAGPVCFQPGVPSDR